MSMWVLGVVVVLSSVLVGACGESPTSRTPPAQTDNTALSFSNDGLEMTDGDCDGVTGPCASVDLNWVVAAGGLAASGVNSWVDGRVRSLLAGSLPGGDDRTAELDDLAEAFLDAYHEFRASFPDSVQRWRLDGQISLVYHAGDLISLRADQAADTGGAHPNSAVFWASFDAGSGRRLGISDLVLEVGAVERLAELEFRRVKGLDLHADLAAAGFTFAEGRFRLSDNLARVENGLAVRWNASEIAPYAAGPTDLLLTVEELGGLLRR